MAARLFGLGRWLLAGSLRLRDLCGYDPPDMSSPASFDTVRPLRGQAVNAGEQAGPAG